MGLNRELPNEPTFIIYAVVFVTLMNRRWFLYETGKA
jgi:hypothetical protein